MRIKKTELKIDPKTPFSTDKMGRSASAVILTDIIDSVNEPYVIAIDAGWGKGKTM